VGEKIQRLAVIAFLLLGLPASAAELPAGFVRLADVAPEIRQEMRYAGSENFVGRPIDGYDAADCWLLADVAEALRRAAVSASRQGWRLVVYDCYRPARAVADFVRWSKDASDQRMKAQYYPEIDKADLFRAGYIATRSQHSKGTTVDVGAEAIVSGASEALDFGSPYDFFGKASWTGSDAVPSGARRNRERLVELLEAEGFKNYRKEWWHFEFTTRADAPRLDVPITAKQ
jgi:D-alanyl-D-alanine dipeptidase